MASTIHHTRHYRNHGGEGENQGSGLFMKPNTTFVWSLEVNQSNPCNLYLRAGKEISTIVGRGTYGDRIGFVLPVVIGGSEEGFAALYYESRHQSIVAKSFVSHEAAESWLQGEILPLRFDLRWTYHKVKITKNSSMILSSGSDVLRASQWLSGLLHDFVQTNGLKVHDGLIDFSSLPTDR